MKKAILAAIMTIAPSWVWAEPVQLARLVPNAAVSESVSVSRRVIVHVIEPGPHALSQNLSTRQANAIRVGLTSTAQ